jgi:hypothetical protein
MRSDGLTSPVNALILLLGMAGCAQRTDPPALAEARSRRDPAPVVVQPSKAIGPVEGWGEDEEQSWDHASEKVKARVDRYLRREVPGLEWYPSADYIRKHLVKESPERRQNRDENLDGRYLKCWAWKAEVSPRDWRDILHHDRELRAEGRMLVLGKILAGLVALLAVVAGYIRLDEWTKGYYTGWLRLGAVGLLAAAGTGLWWLL